MGFDRRGEYQASTAPGFLGRGWGIFNKAKNTHEELKFFSYSVCLHSEYENA
jgi:hypothetical protein